MKVWERINEIRGENMTKFERFLFFIENRECPLHGYSYNDEQMEKIIEQISNELCIDEPNYNSPDCYKCFMKFMSADLDKQS